MTALQRKVCLPGAAGVGKTSLVRRFVDGIFDQRYLSTIGVKIDRRVVDFGRDQVSLALWDIEGETEQRTLRARYLRGASACIFVADGTRPETLEVERELRRKVDEWIPGLPAILLLNKSDLAPRWSISLEALTALRASGTETRKTSALTGVGVEAALLGLAQQLASTSN